MSVPFAATDVERCSCSPAGTDAISPIWLQQSAFRCDSESAPIVVKVPPAVVPAVVST